MSTTHNSVVLDFEKTIVEVEAKIESLKLLAQEEDVDISSAEEINSFDLLKAVVEDMTKHKDELGIQGVFAATAMAPGSDWRWTNHLMNMPLWAEFSENELGLSAMDAGLAATEFEFKYNENFKALFDLYLA